MPPTKVLISSFLEQQHVDTIAAFSPDVEVLYAPELLPTPRYVADHGGVKPELSEVDSDRWLEYLGQADVAFDFDWQDPASLPKTAPNLKWIQATSAGIGAFMQRTQLDVSDIQVTTAAGIHGVPLAEFALTGVLHFIKGVPHLQHQQREHQWQRYTSRQLAGLRVSVVGVGGMGRTVIAAFSALGACVTAVGRVDGSYDVDEGVALTDIGRLDQVLPQTDILVLCTALTPETDGLIGRDRLALLPGQAVLVNISRGQIVDEDALINALAQGKLLGACLDVVRSEPLASDSVLWDFPNVLISPHSASTVASENHTLTSLFVENLERYHRGETLKNLYGRERGY